MSVIGYGDVIYMHASSQSLHALDAVYHGTMRFITNLKALTHHCTMYARVGWPALSICRLHWHVLIRHLLTCFLCT